MIKRRSYTGFICMLFITACALTPASPTPTPAPSSTKTATPIPSPTITSTPTPVVLTLTIKDELVNCRNGPGVIYELMNELNKGETVRVVGRNDASTWWYIRDPGNPNGNCWVSAEVSSITGDTDALPVIGTSASVVTDVNLIVDPPLISVSCDQFPQTFFFKADVSTNGPALVQWQWEASTGALSDVGSMVFEEAGFKTIHEFYPVNSPNDYWVRLHILSPTVTTAEVNFRASCN